MMDKKELFEEFCNIVARLRSPGGCPWDMKQTPETMKGNLLEESYEAIEAVSAGDDDNLREEIGDVLLVLAMLVRIKEEEGSFTMEDVLRDINSKLVRRHPHVFGEVKVKDADEVLKNWNDIKVNVEGKKKKEGLEKVPKSYPSLERAYQLQKQASKVGFDWDSFEGPLAKLEEEVAELRREMESGTPENREKELGDVLFSAVNVSRFIKADPSVALHLTNEKFISRFSYVQEKMAEKRLPLCKENLEIMDSFWNQAKDLD